MHEEGLILGSSILHYFETNKKFHNWITFIERGMGQDKGANYFYSTRNILKIWNLYKVWESSLRTCIVSIFKNIFGTCSLLIIASTKYLKAYSMRKCILKCSTCTCMHMDTCTPSPNDTCFHIGLRYSSRKNIVSIVWSGRV